MRHPVRANVAAALLLCLSSAAEYGAVAAEEDTLADIEDVIGSRSGSIIRGDDGRNVLRGLSGDDTIDGYGGIDWIYAGAGSDSLWGGEDSDFLAGGSGDDVLDGNARGNVLDGYSGNDACSSGYSISCERSLWA